MSSLLSCCFPNRNREEDLERQPLLHNEQTGPASNDATTRQEALHHKFRVYQMFLALSHGNMPSNEQIIANLRAILATDALQADLRHHRGANLSTAGRKLVLELRELIKDFITLLQHKNGQDEIQDLIWHLTKARVSVDINDVGRKMGKAKEKADALAVYRSMQTVGSLLMSNQQFRLLLSDVTTLARGVFKDTALSISNVAEDIGQALETKLLTDDDGKAVLKSSSKVEGKDKVNGSNKDEPGKEIGPAVTEVSEMVKDGTMNVAGDAAASAKLHFSDQANKSVLKARLRSAVGSLAQKPDYDTAVGTLSKVLKQFILTYSRMFENVQDTVAEDVHENRSVDKALESAWRLFQGFGDPKEWQKLRQRFDQVIGYRDRDEDFEEVAGETVDNLEKLLTDPEFSENMEKKFAELRKKSQDVEMESGLKADINALLEQLQRTMASVLQDKDVAVILDRAGRIVETASPGGEIVNDQLIQDSISIFLPVLISLAQTVPIPRLEVSTPTLDLLLENIFVTPGHTVNNSSFLPYHLRLAMNNALDVHKHRATAEVSSHLSTNFSIVLSGLSFRADDVGYIIKTHYPLLPFTSSGLASVALDDRGTDIQLNFDLQRNSLENMLKLRAVKVHVHKLTYKLRRSPFSFFAWLLKPILRPILRKLLERELAKALASMIHALNREAVFARERVRAVEVTQPGSVWSLFKALKARWTPEEDPDVDIRVGLDAPGDRNSKFKGLYAPGSLAGLWHEEERRREEIEVRDEERGWRTSVFDVGA